MSEVADGASALVHSERDLESVIERLLALRAEIDAVLARLPARSEDSSPVRTVAAAEPARALSLSGEATSDGKSADASRSISEKTDPSFAGAGTDKTETVAEAWETARPTAADQPTGEPMARKPDEVDDQPSLAYSNIPASAGAPAPAVERTELAVAPRAAAATEMAVIEGVAGGEQAKQGTVAARAQATGSAPEADKNEERQSAVGAQMKATDAPLAIGATHETVAHATILNFLQARQQKHKSAHTIVPAPARSGRHLAAKIAAAILVFLTAAGVIMMADRTALGGAPPLTGIAPSPPPTVPRGVEWLWQRLRTGQAQSSNAPAALADQQLRREARWPTMPWLGALDGRD
jgi:hypothetical protein